MLGILAFGVIGAVALLLPFLDREKPFNTRPLDHWFGVCLSRLHGGHDRLRLGGKVRLHG